jgi:ATP-dependent RNA helicase RhlE
MKFEDLKLTAPLLRAVAAEGYSVPTPIQEKAIPHLLEGRDLLGCAQTGTGKTAAFALPLLQLLSAPHEKPARGRRIRALVLSPTRELALQIDESFRAYGKHTSLRSTVVYGGVSQNPQTRALRDGVDILVATPGRLLDLMNQGFINLHWVEAFVLDEADRMLDMGFINDIRKIVAKLPTRRQTLLFSATMPTEIRELANSILTNPVSVQVAPVAATTELIEQSVYHVEKQHKPRLLAHFLSEVNYSRVLVFTRTKHGADKVARVLHRAGVKAEALHGDKSQSARQKALANFKALKTPVLVATDIAARGLDIDEISHVVNYDVPREPETYVHRIGRTGRAGASGIAVSFCDREERTYFKAIERLIRKTPALRTDHPDYAQGVAGPNTPEGQKAHSEAHNRPASEGRGQRRKNRGHRSGGPAPAQPGHGKVAPRRKKFAHKL